jgi:hypothetical protein
VDRLPPNLRRGNDWGGSELHVRAAAVREAVSLLPARVRGMPTYGADGLCMELPRPRFVLFVNRMVVGTAREGQEMTVASRFS